MSKNRNIKPTKFDCAKSTFVNELAQHIVDNCKLYNNSDAKVNRFKTSLIVHLSKQLNSSASFSFKYDRPISKRNRYKNLNPSKCTYRGEKDEDFMIAEYINTCKYWDVNRVPERRYMALCDILSKGVRNSGYVSDSHTVCETTSSNIDTYTYKLAI